MITAQTLKNHYDINTNLIRRALADLTDADLMIQAPYTVNCVNWVLGHLLQGRDTVLKLLGAAPQLSDAESERYRRGSDPVTVADGEVVLTHARALAALEQGAVELGARLGALSDEDAGRSIDLFGNNQPQSLLNWVFFFYFHDSYHTGELATVRQLTGKPVKVV